MSSKPQARPMQMQVADLIPALRRFALRFHSSPHDVDDLVQETVLKALSNADKFQEGTSLKSWMFTIMRNSFCTKFAVRKREHVGMEDDAATGPSVAPAQEWVMRGQELQLAIANLPPHHRTALVLTFIDGLSYEEAAARCNCAVGTVKSRVNRARQQLAKQLNSED